MPQFVEKPGYGLSSNRASFVFRNAARGFANSPGRPYSRRKSRPKRQEFCGNTLLFVENSVYSLQKVKGKPVERRGRKAKCLRGNAP